MLRFLDQAKEVLERAIDAGLADVDFSRFYSEAGPDLLDRFRAYALQPPDVPLAYTTARAILRARRIGILLLAPSGQVEFACVQARRLLDRYFPETPFDGRTLPEPLARWAETLLRAGSDAPPATVRQPFVRDGGSWRLVVRMFAVPELPGWYAMRLREVRSEVTKESLEGLGLSPREAEILAFVAQGKTNREIGRLLELSPRTVQTHLAHIFKKVGLETRSAAAIWAFRVANRSE
jgi:DNA-binding CsgD family transcriptional regulator